MPVIIKLTNAFVVAVARPVTDGGDEFKTEGERVGPVGFRFAGSA